MENTDPLLPTAAEKAGTGSIPPDASQEMLRKISTRSTGSSSFRRNREAVGRLRVRCVSAQLPSSGADMKLFRKWTAPTAFAVVYIHDSVTNYQSVRRRTGKAASANPLWKSEFWFAVRQSTGNMVLTVEVFDGRQSSTHDDEPLGCATLTLDKDFLQTARRKRQSLDLELQQADSIARGAGSVRVEVGWEPKLRLTNVADGRSLLWVMVRSVYLVRVMGIATLGFAACLLFVAQQARWLCRGTSLPNCKTVDEPALATCAAIAALTAGTGTVLHFSGLMGLFGTSWDERPHSFVELAEADIEEEEDGIESTTGVEDGLPSVRMQIESVGVLRWNIGLATNLFPRLSLGSMRLLCVLTHLCALCLASVALVIAWLNDEDKVFFAEAVYLDIGGMLCLVTAGLMFCQECILMRSQSDRGVNHHSSCGTGSRRMSGFGNAAGSANPAQAFQEMTSVASSKIKTQIQTLTREAEQLAQPLVEAQQRLQDLNAELTRPLLEEARQQLQDLTTVHLMDARQRLHDRFDDLNVIAQPLSQARQRIQTFGSAPEWIQPLVDAFQPSHSRQPPMPRQMSGGSSQMVSPSHLAHRGNSDEPHMLPVWNSATANSISNSSPVRRSSASEFNADDFGLVLPQHARRDAMNTDFSPVRNADEPVTLEDAPRVATTTRFCGCDPHEQMWGTGRRPTVPSAPRQV